MADYQQGLKGAMGGAAIGSTFGPWGAGIGAVGGGLLGAFGGGGQYSPNRGSFNVPGFQTQYDTYGRLAQGKGGRNAPQMGESAFRGDQVGLIRQLQAEAAGKGVGQQLVRQQAQAAANQAMNQQLAMAQAAAPGGSATAARTAALAGSQAQSQVGMQAAQGGLQAQLGAQGMLGSTLQGARGQDLGRNQANMQSKLQMYGMNDQAQLELLRQRMGLSGMQQGGAMAYEQLRAGQPSQGWGDTLMGLGIGAGQSKMLSQLGRQQQPQGGGQQYGYAYNDPSQYFNGYRPS